MKATERIAANLFGAIFLLLALAVTVETLLRKLFGASLQGVDELGGYALALGSTIAFTLALLDRSHIRIDLIHRKLPRGVRTALNLTSTLLMAGLALSLCGMAWIQIRETLDYGSTAPTPWATPLIYPQTAWFAGLALFALASLALAIRGIWLLRAGKRADFDRDFGPRGLEDELREELDDLRQRGLAESGTDAALGKEVTA